MERQLEDCRRIAEARGWSICEIYTEKPISAFAETKKRPAYDRMVEDYRAGRLNALITWDLDRLNSPATPAPLHHWFRYLGFLRTVCASPGPEVRTGSFPS
ncbi:recombinase family protein [Nocardia sp. NPDC004151]|uniref:recombinase family protein n=1 Tax=Nocardia sp. NPDC004151 TaxID=3364304 RepID=UPI003691F8CE